MDVLINVIIILVIIITIFKRMQEVAKKGGDITGQPSAPPSSHGWPELSENEPEIFEEEAPYPESASYPEMKPAESPRRNFAEKIYRYEEERKEGSFISPQTEPPGEHQLAYESVPKMVESRKRTGNHRIGGDKYQLCPALTACSSELVRGIILSEILGKPVALRSETRW
ncbi:MAG: hypothetical protein WCU00_02150 [Candidatus Latescibacterota bacterium]